MAVQEDNQAEIIVRTKPPIAIVSESIPKDFDEASESNVIIKCCNQEFVVARSALCKFSKKMRQMSLKINPKDEWEISMTSVPKEILQKVLDFLRTGELKLFDNLGTATLFSILSLVHSLEMTEVETSILSLLVKKAESFSTIAYLWDLSQKYDNTEAILEIERFTQDNIVEMINEGFFKAVSWPQMCGLMNHFNTEMPLDSLCIAVLQWLKMDPDKKSRCAHIARRLDWRRLSHGKICQLIFTEPLFRRILKHSMAENLWVAPQAVTSALSQFRKSRAHAIGQEVANAKLGQTTVEDEIANVRLCSYSMAWHHNTPIEQVMPSKNSIVYMQPKICNPAFLLVGANRNNSLSVQVYFVKTREWTIPLDTSLQLRSDFGCSYHRQNLYLLGGDRGDGNMFENCYTYNVFNYRLKEFTPFRHPRCKAGVVNRGNDLFVIGGLNEKRESVSVALKIGLSDRYEIWKPLKPMKERRKVPGVVVDPFGQVIVIGGHATSCEYYNKHGWVEMESLPAPYKNYGMCATYCTHKVYAFRDFNPSEVCIFDMVKNDLKIVPTPGTSPSQIVSICSFGSEIWVINPKGQFYIYCIDTNTWRKTPLKSTDMTHFFYITIIDQDDVRNYDDESVVTVEQDKLHR